MHQRLCSAINASFANISSTHKEELQYWGFLLFLGEVLTVLKGIGGLGSRTAFNWGFQVIMSQ